MGAVFPCNLGLSSFTPNSNKPDIIIIIIKTSCLCSDIAGVIFGFYREINLDQMFPNKESVIEKSSAKY